MGESWRLAVGTLTTLPVRPVDRVDVRTTRGAMLLAPLAVLPLGALVVLVLVAGSAARLPPLAVAFVRSGCWPRAPGRCIGTVSPTPSTA
jgi:adenosylcobinamide-GDP ribazoletransferase